MTVYQPYQGYLTAYQSGVTNVMREVWDPVILQTSFRAGDVTKYFKPTTTPWPKGKKLHIRVQDQLLNTARFIGTLFSETSNVGVTLPNPPQTMEWAEWQIAHTDLMTIDCPVRYAFPTQEIMDPADIPSIAELLSRESLANVAETTERGLITSQQGHVAKIKAVGDKLTAYQAGSAAFTTADTDTARLWIDQSAILFSQGAVVDVVCKDVGVSSSLRGIVVENLGAENPASGVYGFIDVNASVATGTAASFIALAAIVRAASPQPYIYMSGEWVATKVPESAPAATTGLKDIYGLYDWFKPEVGTATTGRNVGTIYNINRATLGNQWAVPIMLDKYSSGDVVVALEYIDNLLVSLSHKRLNQPKLTNLVILAGPNMVLELTRLTSSVNRRVDGAIAGTQTIVTNYGFDGIMIHHPSLGQPVAVQAVRGLPENIIYVIQPGVCEMVQPGGVQWLEWAPGITFFNEMYTSGAQGGTSRTAVYRADRIVMGNSLIRVPRFCGALSGVKPS